MNYQLSIVGERIELVFNSLPYKKDVSAINKVLAERKIQDYFLFNSRSNTAQLVKVGKYNPVVKMRDTRKAESLIVGKTYRFKKEKPQKSVWSSEIKTVSLDTLYNV